MIEQIYELFNSTNQHIMVISPSEKERKEIRDYVADKTPKEDLIRYTRDCLESIHGSKLRLFADSMNSLCGHRCDAIYISDSSKVLNTPELYIHSKNIICYHSLNT